MSNKPLIPRWQRISYVILMAFLAVTGIGQMPIYKRYYVTELPGMAWLGEFYSTHTLHYLAAAYLMALLGFFLTKWAGTWRMDYRITAMGWVRAVIMALLVFTGALRVIKNQPDVFMSPFTVMVVDWAHLFLAMLMGLAALAALLMGKRPYAEKIGP